MKLKNVMTFRWDSVDSVVERHHKVELIATVCRHNYAHSGCAQWNCMRLHSNSLGTHYGDIENDKCTNTSEHKNHSSKMYTQFHKFMCELVSVVFFALLFFGSWAIQYHSIVGSIRGFLFLILFQFAPIHYIYPCGTFVIRAIGNGNKPFPLFEREKKRRKNPNEEIK